MSNTTKILVGALLACGIAAGAGAATTPKPMNIAKSNRCDELTAQFDAAKASHSSAKDYSRAVTERDSGAALCKAGNPAKGAQNLAKALQDIGVKPIAG